MERERTVNKLLLNIKKFHVPLQTALNQAYMAGYDARGKELTAHNKKRIIQFNSKMIRIAEYDSVIEAAKQNKVGVQGLYSAIYRKSRTKKGYYWRYADDKTDNKENSTQEDREICQTNE